MRDRLRIPELLDSEIQRDLEGEPAWLWLRRIDPRLKCELPKLGGRVFAEPFHREGGGWDGGKSNVYESSGTVNAMLRASHDQFGNGDPTVWALGGRKRLRHPLAVLTCLSRGPSAIPKSQAVFIPWRALDHSDVRPLTAIVSVTLSIIGRVRRAKSVSKSVQEKVPVLRDIGRSGRLEWELIPDIVIPLTWLELRDLKYEGTGDFGTKHSVYRRPILLGKFSIDSLPIWAREPVSDAFQKAERLYQRECERV
mmetsp:Transcript_61118/g.150397  ORF Transcript_61118/g.150397 Transcript_61118/m.150397 type:complete len:253 (+) Transcript_61118:523-1281(+)